MFNTIINDNDIVLKIAYNYKKRVIRKIEIYGEYFFVPVMHMIISNHKTNETKTIFKVLITTNT